MITFPYIEDYLEVLGGFRAIQAQGTTPGPATLFQNSNPVSLARYDVNVVQSMASHTVNNGSLTDRQSELVIKIVAKYRRQFKNLGVDVEPILANPVFRRPIRVIDRKKSFTIKDNIIVARFPYDKKIIDLFSTAAKENYGRCYFDRDLKEWHLGLTTYNVNWAVALAKEYNFELSQDLLNLMNGISEVESQGYSIELGVDHNGQLMISNAEPSLISYIEKNIGSLENSNLVNLIDHAPILAYTVSNDLIRILESRFDPVVNGLLLNKQCHCERVLTDEPGVFVNDFFTQLRTYLDISNRYPIYVYEPDTLDRLKKILEQIFTPNEIIDITYSKNNNYLDNPEVKCVYFNKIKKSMNDKIPILLCTNAMLYGVDKQYMLQLAEKVIYYTPTTLNKEAKTIASEVNN